ncbi:CRAL/TRIO domain protein [Aspergillus campestris IBT 28561]|uniref:CRAL/TRIO domain protein n=1 Tax=Aspergillus campestris (strain IBT 28561) TaxID=1392248 RepID=A0A2I1DBU4_ASPC2|nr:CRAL/TRIO domain protein [Aspergillus campestris IBT 28561]PKY07333.1 CRAL/TRIO domain protein [Aspergillus campestris IBT 28561]
MHVCSPLSRRLAHSSAKSTFQFPTQRLRHPVRVQVSRPLHPSPAHLALSYPPARSLSTFPSLKEPREASSFWTVTFTLLLICGGSWLHDKYRNPRVDSLPQNDDVPSDSQPSEESFLGVLDTFKGMTNAEAAPGTVGNLTPEQEAKLQELWILLCKVCGIKLDGLEAAEAPGSRPGSQPGSSQQPKRRWTLWGGKDEDASDSASVKSGKGISSGLSGINLDGDDKHGQSKEFQQALEDMTPEEIRVTVWNMVKQDNPDSLLLRFLRARKWDVHKALIMFISTIRWRLHDVKVDDDIMRGGEQLAYDQTKSADAAERKKGEDFLTQMRLGKSFLHGVDKQGRPICTVRVRLHRANEQSAESLDRFTVYTIETARMMLVPPVETACIVFDMSNFSLANMDYHPVNFMIKCFEANYPESLGVVLIHKAPWIFSGVWNIIKGWLDPVVASKVHFTKSYQDLEKFINKDQIWTELEGKEDWEYKYVEVKPDENKHMEDSAKRDAMIAERQELAKDIEAATVGWLIASRKKDQEATKAAVEKRAGLIDRLRAQYWELDPYIRATSLYDRVNIIQGGGKVNFYPEEAKNPSSKNSA